MSSDRPARGEAPASPGTESALPGSASRSAGTGGAAAVPRRGELPGAVASEWTKLWSVQSTWVCLASAAGLLVAYTVISGAAARSGPPSGGAEGTRSTSPLDITCVGVVFMAQFAVLALATMVIATEYSTGSIRSTLQWVPVRHRMLLAKAAVVLPVCFVLGLLLVPLGVGTSVLALGDAADAVTAGGVAARACAVGGYLAGTGVVVIGIGAAVHSVAGTLTVSILMTLVLPMSLQATSVEFLATAGDYLPGPAGQVLMGVSEDIPYGNAAAVLLLAGWAAVACGAGYAVLRSRDA